MKDQRNTLQKLQEGIKRTWKHITIPVMIAVFSVIAQPTKAQNELPDNLKYLEALVDTINIKPIEAYFTKFVADNAKDSADIKNLFNEIYAQNSEARSPTTKIMKMIYEEDISDYKRCILLALVIDPKKETAIGKRAENKIGNDPLLQNSVRIRKESINNVILLEQSTIELEKADIELAKEKENLQKKTEELEAYKNMVKMIENMLKNTEEKE